MRGRISRVAALVAGVLSVMVLTAGSAAAGTGSQNTHFKVAYWESASGVYWTCTGVHKISKTGAVSESETCTTLNTGNGFVAGTYVSNALVFPAAFPAGCGGYEPGLPGYSAPHGYTYFVSDDPGFGQCAQFVSWTFAPRTGGGWTDTLQLSY